MTSGISLFLIAVGAILYFAVNASVSGLEIDTVGIILMIVGAIGFLWSLFASTGRAGPSRPRPRSMRWFASGASSAARET